MQILITIISVYSTLKGDMSEVMWAEGEVLSYMNYLYASFQKKIMYSFIKKCILRKVLFLVRFRNEIRMCNVKSYECSKLTRLRCSNELSFPSI